jgi:hypothetical protein
MHAYRQSFQTGSADMLAAAIARNCFLTETPVKGRDDVLAAKAMAFDTRLKATTDEAILSGAV